MDVEVFDRGWPISEARLRADRHHLLAPRFSLFTRVPYLKDSNLSVFADRGRVKHAPSRWAVADTELLAHLVVLAGCDPRLDEPCCRHTNLLARRLDITPMRRVKLASPRRHCRTLAHTG